ncbi:MAG: hypothetical protein D6702_03085 [Planctomycetota bacterium]|nr:MAG: hypothetical protein D6702_03085 [Planctomycetota bacterium]
MTFGRPSPPPPQAPSAGAARRSKRRATPRMAGQDSPASGPVPARIPAMPWGILAGAGLVGLLDSALRLKLPDAGLWRETALVVLGGDLLLALAVCLLVSTRRRSGLRTWSAFGLGAGVAGAPLLGSLLPVEPFGLVALVALPILARGADRLLPRPGRAFAVLALPAPVALVAALLLPPTDVYAVRAPELPPAEADAPAFGSDRPPDLVLVSVDTLRADRVLALADRLPNLTALRERGTWAEYGLSSTNQTVPAHVTLLSGLGALEHGVRHNHDVMGEGVRLLGQDLQEAGWNTAAVVSNGLLRGVMGFARGFDAFDDSEVAPTGIKLAFRRMVKKDTWVGWLGSSRFVFQTLVPWLLPRPEDRAGPSGAGRRTTDRALHFLAELVTRPQPFFLFVHYLDPHHPYRPPAETAGTLFDPEELPPEYRGGPLADNEMMFRLRDELAAADPAVRERALRAARALESLYDEEILFIDRELGRLLAAVERSGRPTVVLFTSDHGEHFGEHGLVLHSCSLYEELVRVPFILAGPGVPVRRLSSPPHLEDVVPTLRSLAGLPPDPTLRGRDLTRGEPAPAPHLERYQAWLSYREGPWKLIARFHGREVEPVELYRVDQDPVESRNLLHEQPATADRLAELARAELAAARTLERGDGAVDPDVQAALLEELGYAGDGG